jgi:hypothetical protein
MRDIVKYLFVLLGINANEADIVGKDMLFELSQLRDNIAFIAFCKEENGKDDYRFLNGYQKFLSLIKKYKEFENEAYFYSVHEERIQTKKQEALAIVTKLAKHKSEISGLRCLGKPIDFTKYLTDNEINILPLPVLADNVLELEYTYEKIIQNFIDGLRSKFFNKKEKEITFNFQDDKKVIDIAKKALRKI